MSVDVDLERKRGDQGWLGSALAELIAERGEEQGGGFAGDARERPACSRS